MTTIPRAGSAFMAAFALADARTRGLIAGDLLFDGVAALTPEGERVEPLDPQRVGVLVASPTGWSIREIVTAPIPALTALACCDVPALIYADHEVPDA